MGVPSSSSPSPLRPKELASLPGPPGALNKPLSGSRAKRWKKDVYKLLKGKKKKVGGRAKRLRPPGSVDWGLSGEERESNIQLTRGVEPLALPRCTITRPNYAHVGVLPHGALPNDGFLTFLS